MKLTPESKPEVATEVAGILANPKYIIEVPQKNFGPYILKLNFFKLMEDADNYNRLLCLMTEQVEDLTRQLTAGNRNLDAIAAVYPYHLASSLAVKMDLPVILSGKSRGIPMIDPQGPRADADINKMTTVIMVGYSRGNGGEEIYAARKITGMRLSPAASLVIIDTDLAGVNHGIISAGVQSLGSLTNPQAIRAARRAITSTPRSPLPLPANPDLQAICSNP